MIAVNEIPTLPLTRTQTKGEHSRRKIYPGCEQGTMSETKWLRFVLLSPIDPPTLRYVRPVQLHVALRSSHPISRAPRGFDGFDGCVVYLSQSSEPRLWS